MTDPIIQNKRKRMPDKSWHRGAHCPYCADTGWVELAGTEVVLGVVYPRGVTACRWCQEGIDCFSGSGVDHRGRALESQYDASHLASAPASQGRSLTFAEYAATAEGQADPHVADLAKMLESRRRVRKDELPARVGGDPQPLTASVTAESDLLTPRKAEA